MIRGQRLYVIHSLEFVWTLPIMASKYYVNSSNMSAVKKVNSGILLFLSFYGHFLIPYLVSLGKNKIIR